MVGGGSLPEEGLPTKLLALGPAGEAGKPRLRVAGPARSAEELARLLREHNPPVVARIERDVVLLDPRTVHPREDRIVIEGLRAALAS